MDKAMRLILPAAAALLLAACATRPPPAVEQPRPVPQAQPMPRGALVGQSVPELVGRFGAPMFQVREGPALKLQWSNAACVLDVYLYRPGNGAGAERATYAETRRPTGDPVEQASCIAALDAAR